MSSQTNGNLAGSRIDHLMKLGGKRKGYVRYCDDVLGLARTKAEAVRDMMMFRHLAEAEGFVVKATAFVSRIGENIGEVEERERRLKGRRKRTRKRQRGGTGKKDRLLRLQLHAERHPDAEEHQAEFRPKDEENER